MTSEQRREESEAYWFKSPAARNVLENFVPSREDDETILSEKGQEPQPVTLTPETNIEDVVRNEPEPEPEEFTNVYDFFASKQGKELVQEKFKERGIEGYEVGELFPREQRGLGGEAVAGGARGIDQTQAMGFGLLGLMGEVLEVEGLSDLGVEGYKRNMEEAAKNMASVQDPFEEIGGVGDFALYATGVLSEQLPQLMLSLLGGGVGGLAAKTVAKKVIANEIGKRVAAGMAKDEAEEVVAKLVAQKALRGFDVPFARAGGGDPRIVGGIGQEAMQQATRAGALGGAYVANVGQIAGGSFGEIEQETGQRDPVNALGFALLGGALETGAEALMLAPVANKLIGRPGTGGFLSGRGVENATAGMAVGPGTQTAIRLAATPPSEGLTEYGQTFTEQAAVASADPNRTLAEVAFTPEAERERQIAGAAGVVAGGGFAGVSQAASYLIPETARAVQSKLAQRQAEQGQQEQEQQQEAPADEEWSEPVTIQSRNEDYNGLEYRQNKAGQVWAFNVPEVSRFGAFAIPTKYGQGVLLNPAFEGASDIRSEVKARLAEMADPEAFKAPPVTPPKEAEEELEDADLADGDAVVTQTDAMDAAAERRRLRDLDVIQRDRGLAQATLSRPQDDAKSFVESLNEGDQVSVLTEDGEGNAYSIPMTFVRVNQSGQAQLRSELDEDNKVVTRLYDQDEFNRITTRITPDAGATDDPMASVLKDALGPNPTKTTWQAVTGTPWTGKGNKHTVGMKDGLGGTIPITFQAYNRKTPAGPIPVPQRQVAKGFKPEEQTTAPAAPDIDAKGPDLVFKSSAEFTGIRNKTDNTVLNARPTRGQENANYLQAIDSAADTTIRQMNKLGQAVLVTPETAQSLAEANAFWEEHAERQRTGTARKDRQPVRFFTQERSDKNGNRNTFITGVTYEGRTYRVGSRPDRFSVDRPLTSRGANSRRMGLGVYDQIRIASQSRLEKSEAAMAGSQKKTEQGPLAAALTGVQGRPAMSELNDAENAVFAFFDDRITQPIQSAESDDITQEVRDRALEGARARLAKAFVKAKANAKGAPSQVPPARQRVIGRKVADRMAGYQDAKRGLAVQALREKFQAIQAKTKSAKAGARGTGAAKALKMSPESANRIIAEARRGQKTNILQTKRMSRDEALTALQELVDFGALDQKKKDDQIRKIFGEGEKFNDMDRDFMSEQIISELADEDRAIAAKQGRQYARTTAEVARDRRLIKSVIGLLADDNIRKLNPFRVGANALGDAKQAVQRRDMTRPTISMDDEASGAEAAVLTTAQDDAPINQASLAEKGKPLGIEGAQGGDIAPFSDNFEEAYERMDSLSESDKDILFKFHEAKIEQPQGQGGQTKQQQSEVDRLWATRLNSYVNGSISRKQLEAFREEERRFIERTVPQPRTVERTNLLRGVSTQSQLAGVAESRAGRSSTPSTEGRPERVVGTPADTAGTVQGQSAGQTGGRSVQPTPRRTREVAAASQRDFAGALIGLNEAETAALPQAVVDRIYQSYLSAFDGVLAEQGNNPLTASAAPAADTVTADGKKMFERFASARLSPNQQRAAIIRSNMAQAYRAGLFDDDPVMSAINKIAADKTQPMNLRLMAKEFVKNAKRGVRFDRVVLDIGRFTKPGNKQTTWAGLFSLTPEGAPVVSVNLDNLHDKNSVPLTFLHELQHVVIRDKVRRSIPLTRTEEEALARLEDLRSQAVIAAARQQGIEVGTTPDVNALAERLYALTDPNSTQSGAAVDNRRLAGLVNLEEFVIEMIGNPDMARLLSELGFGEARADGKRFSLTGALRNAWNAVVELLTGVKVDPTSPLAMAFKDSWTVNFGTSRNPNITEIKASKRLADRQQVQTRARYVESEIEARDLAGTTRDRKQIIEEIAGPADRSAEENENRIREAAQTLTKEEFVQWSQDNEFNFVDPQRLYSDIREEAGLPAEAMGITKNIAWLADQPKEIEKRKKATSAEIRQAVDRAQASLREFINPAGVRERETWFDENQPLKTAEDVQRAANELTENEFVKWANTNGFSFVDPTTVYRGLRPAPRSKAAQEQVPEQQATGDTVQEETVAEEQKIEIEAAKEEGKRKKAKKQKTSEPKELAPEKPKTKKPKASVVERPETTKAEVKESVDESENSKEIQEANGFGLDWSPYKEVNTKNGSKRVKTAKLPMNHPFWKLWKAEKEWLRSLGYSPKKRERNQWDLSRWQADVGNVDLPKDTDIPASAFTDAAQSRAVRISPQEAGADLLRLAQGMGQNFFSLPRNFSTSKDLGEVLASTSTSGQQFKLFNTSENSISIAVDGAITPRMRVEYVSWRDSSDDPLDILAEEDSVVLPKEDAIPESAFAETEDVDVPEDQISDSKNPGFRVVAVTEDTAEILEAGVRKEIPLENVIDVKNIKLKRRTDTDFYIDSGSGSLGSIDSAESIYQGIYQWALNNGYRIVPDPRGTTPSGNYRRNAHQLSSALRTGRADYFVPTTEQLGRMFPMARGRGGKVAIQRTLWDAATTEEKIAALARAEISYVEQVLPELVSMSYDPRTDLFTDAEKSRSLSRQQAGERLNSIVAGAKKPRAFDPERVGVRTMSRYSAEKAALAGVLGRELAGDNRRRPNLEPVAYSRAVRRPFASETATTYNGKTYTRPGLIFGENANLDPRATELVSILKRVKRAAEQYANLKGRELNRLIKKYYKDEPVPTDLINDALGNLDNPLTDQQFDEIKRLELTDPEAAVKKRIAYLGENRARFRTERQAPALLALPEELAEFLREIGKDGDLAQLQEEALKLGIPKGDMATAFSENLGIYLTRSYNAFIDQEGWERTLRSEDAALGEQSRMGQFRNQIRDTLIGQRADDLQTKAQEEGRTLSRAEAERLAKEGTTTEEVDQMLESYIAYTKEEASSESFSGLRLPGRQNIKSLEQRKRLSDALREFYGQVENPAVNFVTSYAKLSSLIANHKFQTELKNLGLKEGWIWDPEKNRGQRPPSGYERIAADNDKSLKVLAGLYARSDLVRGLRETFPPNSMEAAQWWLHPFMRLTGLSMGLKTVGSMVSQIRNYWSSYAPIIAGGNMTVADWFRPEWRKNWKEAHEVSIANVFRKYGGDRQKMTNRIKRLYELGVMGESLTVGLLNDLTRLGKDASISDEQFFNNFEKILKKPGRRVWNATKQVWEKAEQVYGMTDDIFKVLTYLSEFDKYQKVYPNMSESELERKASDIARDIHWTYSKAPAAVNELKKFPFIAPFVTFTTETIRITANLGKLAINERKEGQRLREQGLRENNAELVRQGDELLKISNKRMRGMAAVAFGPWALGSLAMTAAGFSGDDEEDLRQFLPDWQKNSQIIILGKNGSDINYVDVSYLDPFEVWKKPMTAFMRGLGRSENVEEFFTEAVVGAALEAARPFTSEQILSGAVMDVMRNRDANGRQVYNPQDTGTAIATAVGAKLASAFTPGTMDTVDRIYKASAGQMSETGRAYQPFNEWGSLVFGQRVSAVDAEQALGFKASQFLRARRDARSIFNRDYLSRGSRSESDVISAYQRSNVGLRDVTEQLRREYIAALNLGVSPAKARSVLRAAGLDRDSARMVSTGIYRRLTPSEEQDRMAAPERKRAARQAIAETPQREVLFP